MANLIQARVRVAWGKINLTSYNGNLDFPQGAPVVYDVEVSLQAETEGPTATMKWDPTGRGMAVYESFLNNPDLMATQIVIEYFYPGGKRLPLVFVWTGQQISYGNDMTVIVKMQSELAGLINANLRNIAKADVSDKGINAIQLLENSQKQFGLEKNQGLIRYNESAKKDMTKAKLATNYATDTTFGAQVSQIAQQTGNVAYANSIEEANIVLFPPYSYDKTGKVYNGVTDIPDGGVPDPTKRYGYLLGPGLITTLTRSVEWKPPQQTNQNTPSTQTRALPDRDKYGRFTKKAPSQPQNATSSSLTPTSSPLGTANGRSTPGIGNKDNPDQVPKQNALNEEKTATLSMNTYLVPALLGVKPHDILYIPSFKGNYIEDWIVQSVDYNQSDGKVEIGIQATRVYGVGTPMNEEQAKVFLNFAKSNDLVGSNWSLEAWDRYAWVSENPIAPVTRALSPAEKSFFNPTLPPPSPNLVF
jgi:hypothetical protein